jgi:DNA repair protein RecO (recombination protein O)
MPSETLRGIVLRHANYRDHDRMLTIFSPEHGRVEALSRGCRRPKSPLLTASEVFAQGEFVLFRSGDRYTLTSCAIADTYYPLRLEPYRLTCASYLLGLAQAAAQPGEAAPELYGLLLEGLARLAYQSDELPLTLTTAFLLLYAGIIGYKPRMNHCAHCRVPLDTSQGALLDVEAGGLVCAGCGGKTAYRLSAAQVAWMRAVLREGALKGLQEDTEAEPLKEDVSDLFVILRRYVESRLEAVIKGSRLLP